MIKNYIKIAWRNINRHKMYTAINVLGLALGICACIVIYLITDYDFSFDRFQLDRERIYRVVGEIQRSSGEKDILNSPTSDVAGFEHRVPGFENTAAFHLYGADVTIPGDKGSGKKFGGRLQTAGSWSSASIITGPQYFDIFKYHWLFGSAAALSEPYKVVLSQKRAKQYFGDIPLQEMIGKKVMYEDSLRVEVAGIVEDWNKNSDFGFTDFISVSTATHSFLKNHIPTEDWSSLSPHQSMAFVKLNKGISATTINHRFATFIKSNVKLGGGATLTMRLQPLSDIHFTKDFHRGDDGDNFYKPYLPALYALMGIAIFILTIAIVNFINLSTAQSIQRAKEIGVRKVLGSNKIKIVYQFLTETTVITSLAVIIAVLLVGPALIAFKDYIPQGISFHVVDPSTLIFLLAVTVITALLAGMYPAKVLADYLPVLSLKGAAVQYAPGKVNLRKALIVFQFTISLVFIIGALVIGKQINYMSKADKGFNTDAVITIYNWGDHEGKLKVFAEKARQLPGVFKVLQQGTAPMGFAQNIDNFKYKAKDEITLQVSAQIGNNEFIPFYGMRLLAGRNMVASDSSKELVVNETLARRLGFSNPQDAVGKLLYQQVFQGEKPYPIVGVVADFHTGSFHEAIQPTVIENVPARKTSVAIKLAADEKDLTRVKATLAKIEGEWKGVFPDANFEYSLLNESIATLYFDERKTEWLMNMAMGITIFISCMGLFGLIMFTTERKSKEIGIRKVLGASVPDIMAMLGKDFVRLVMIAIAIASPIGWYFMNQWLQDYSYRTDISWWVFLVAGFFALVVTIATISFQAIKAAIANPIKSLRTE